MRKSLKYKSSLELRFDEAFSPAASSFSFIHRELRYHVHYCSDSHYYFDSFKIFTVASAAVPKARLDTSVASTTRLKMPAELIQLRADLIAHAFLNILNV